MKTSQTARPVSTPNARRRNTGSSLEALESRIAPAMTAAGVFSFTDTDGDIIKIQVSGKFTSVTFKDSGGNEVIDGDNIASIEIDKPLTDFALIFSDTNPGVGNDEVELGKISGLAGARLPIINKIATVDSSVATVYHLTSFIGTDFSAGGGLKILGDLTGGGAGSGIDLLNVSKDATVSLRDGIAAGATATVANNVAGFFFVGPVAGDVTLKTVSGSAQFGDLSGKITVLKDLTGRIGVGNTAVDIGGTPLGLLELKGSSKAAARIIGGTDLNVKIGVNAAGLIQSIGDPANPTTLTLNVGKSISGATVIAGGDLNLQVADSVVKSSIFAQGKIVAGSLVTKDVKTSTIFSGDDLTLEIGNGLTGSKVDTGAFGDLTVTGVIGTSKISSGDDLTITGGKGITGSEIAPDGNLMIGLVGDVSKSVLTAKDSSLILEGTGKLSGSELFAGTELTVTMGKDISATKLTSGSLMTVNASGKVAGTRMMSGDNLVANITGAVTSSQFLPGNDLNVIANGSVSSSRFESVDGDTDLTVIGSMVSTTIDSGATATIDLHKPVPNTVKINAVLGIDVTASGDLGAAIVGADDVTVTTPGGFIGSIRAAGDVTLDVGYLGQKNSALIVPPAKPGAEVTAAPVAIKTYVAAGGNLSLSASAGVNATFIEVGGDVVGFSVIGNFGGIVRVAGDFVIGDTINPATVVTGFTTGGSLFEIAGNVGDVNSSPKLVFSKGFLGRMVVGGKLLTDLQFDGAASRLSFEGGIGAAVSGDNIADIVVAGNLTQLSTGSLYASVNANTGNFVDGSGVIGGRLNVTGTIVKPVVATNFGII